MDYLFDYLSFLAKAVTIVVAIVVVIGAATAAGMRRHRPSQRGHVEVTRLNDRLRDLGHALAQAMMAPGEFKKRLKEEKKEEKRAEKKAEKQTEKAEKQGEKREAKQAEQAEEPQEGETDPKAPAERPCVFVIGFDGDLEASGIAALRNEITAILTTAREGDEVVVRIESGGGHVHAYGLGASQLSRIKARGIRLVAAIDKIAASGGYLMAAVADRILAAPFAVVGSIGVVAQVPNVHRLLKKHDVDVEVLTAGEYKRTLTVLGENTEKGRAKFIEELEDVHALFKEFVGDNRPDLDLGLVATGEAWYGRRAIERNLVDELRTSDEYLMAACGDNDVFEVKWVEPRKPMERLLEQWNAMLGDGPLARLFRKRPGAATRLTPGGEVG